MLHDLFKYISILYFINALNAFWKRINLIAKEVSLKYGFIDWLWLMPCATVENSQRCQVLEHDLLMRILDMRHTVPILIMSTIQNTISVWMWSRINLMSNCTFFHSDIDLLFGFASVCVCVFFVCPILVAIRLESAALVWGCDTMWSHLSKLCKMRV